MAEESSESSLLDSEESLRDGKRGSSLCTLFSPIYFLNVNREEGRRKSRVSRIAFRDCLRPLFWMIDGSSLSCPSIYQNWYMQKFARKRKTGEKRQQRLFGESNPSREPPSLLGRLLANDDLVGSLIPSCPSNFLRRRQRSFFAGVQQDTTRILG